MWELSGPCHAEFRANGWKLVVTSGEPAVGGVRLLACREDLAGGAARIFIPGGQFSPCVESFVRGDALHLCFPDTDLHATGVELVLTAVEADQGMLVVESVVAVNTPLLDAHPTIKMEVGAGHPGFPQWGKVRWESLPDTDQTAWLRATARPAREGPGVATFLLYDRRDHQSRKPLNDTTPADVEFFGDFLEKGVIRKIQPWWVWSNGSISRTTADRIAKLLASRPLALSN
jgi:hypothetical protein